MGKLFVGDCLNIMPKLEVGSIDMILCDLPYGTTACSWDSIIDLEQLWYNYKRIIKSNGAIVLTSAQPFTSKLVMSNLAMFKYQWVWDKVRGGNFATTKIRPFMSHEDICVFYSHQCTYNPQMWQGKPYIQKQGYVGEAYAGNDDRSFQREAVVTVSDGSRYPLSIIRISKESGLHPTQKPVPLFEYLIKTYTNENDTVLDNCCGSGTTGVACQNLKRNFILIEQDLEYAKIAQKRLIDNAARLKNELS
jgi:site-specific DNA-methyltransferase (adenine-specific)